MNSLNLRNGHTIVGMNESPVERTGIAAHQ